MPEKFVILIGDGMADLPLEELNGRTPLQVARTPHMDRLASGGLAGTVCTVPDGMPPGSDVATLSILGYDPVHYYSGRSPLEAASMGITLGPTDVAFRCNLVNLKPSATGLVMADYSAGHISTEESRELITFLTTHLAAPGVTFYAGLGYRHLLVWKDGPLDLTLTPPHDIHDQEVADYFPKGKGREVILQLMNDAQMLLADHPVNRRRDELGLPQANSIWLWGHGRPPALPSFQQQRGLSGAVISAVDLVKGVGRLVGLEVIPVSGATGYLDTNYRGKVEAALAQICQRHLVLLHVEAPDEASHSGDLEAKIQALEDFDDKVVGPICEGLRPFPSYRILLLPDHASPLALRTHIADPVPFVLYGTGVRGNGVKAYNEVAVGVSAIHLRQGFRLIEALLSPGPVAGDDPLWYNP